MTNMKFYRIIILLTIFSCIIVGCSDDMESSIPVVPKFRVECDMRQAAYSSLNAPGQFVMVEKNSHGYKLGYAGLIVGQSAFPGFNNEKVFLAFDRACPVESNSNVAVDLVNDAVGTAICPKCKTEYDLNNGGAPKGVGKEYLRKYSVVVRGDIIIVSN